MRSESQPSAALGPAGPAPAGAGLFSAKAVRWQWGVLVVLLVYVLAPSAIFTVVEGDDVNVAQGVWQLATRGMAMRGLVYRYDFQPGTYLLILAQQKLFGLDPMIGFCVLTVAGFILFFLAATCLVSALVRVPLPLAGLVLLLFQESFIATYFANSSMVAAGFLYVSFWLALRRSAASGAAAGVLFAFAMLARFDAALLAPSLAVAAVAPWRKDRVRRAAMAAVVAAGTLFGLGALAGVSFGELLGTGSRHLAEESGVKLTLGCYLSFFSVLVAFLVLLGLRQMLARRAWHGALLAGLGIVPMALAYGSAVTTPKYLLFALPLLAVPAAEGLRRLYANRTSTGRPLRWIAIGLFVLQYLATPLREMTQIPYLPPHRIYTHDGYRNLDGMAWSPLWWGLYKSNELQAAREGLSAFLSEQVLAQDQTVIVTDEYTAMGRLLHGLFCRGFRCEENDQLARWDQDARYQDFYVFQKTGQTVIVTRLPREGFSFKDEQAWRRRIAPGSRHVLFFLGIAPRRLDGYLAGRAADYECLMLGDMQAARVRLGE